MFKICFLAVCLLVAIPVMATDTEYRVINRLKIGGESVAEPC